MAALDLNDAIRRIRSLRSSLRDMSDDDPEQELIGPALQTVDAVLSATRELIPAGDPVLDRMTDVISPEAVQAGEPPRAIDVLLLADQVYDALLPNSSDASMTPSTSVLNPARSMSGS
jgi:hypothetical protein